MCSAIQQDLGKSNFEFYSSDINWCKNDVLFTCKNLKQEFEMKEFEKMGKRERGSRLLNSHDFGQLGYSKPSLVPLVGAMAGGNTSAMKLSENAPN